MSVQIMPLGVKRGLTQGRVRGGWGAGGRGCGHLFYIEQENQWQ